MTDSSPSHDGAANSEHVVPPFLANLSSGTIQQRKSRDGPTSNPGEEDVFKMMFCPNENFQHQSVEEVEQLEVHNNEGMRSLSLAKTPSAIELNTVERALEAAWDSFQAGGPVWQAVVIVTATFFTYSISTRLLGSGIGPNLAEAVVTTFASLAIPHMITHVATGSYGAMTSDLITPNYGWVALHAVLTACVWMSFVRYKIFVGFSGRLGVAAWTACLIAVLILGASTARSNEEWASLFRRDTYWEDMTVIRRVPKMPVIMANPVAAASSFALCAMLVVSCTGYKLTDELLVAIGQGSFVGMGSFDRLPLTSDFVMSGIFSSGVNLLVFPFFNGWGGRVGFMAFVGGCMWQLMDQPFPPKVDPCRQAVNKFGYVSQFGGKA
eukprot:gene21975-29035_t